MRATEISLGTIDLLVFGFLIVGVLVAPSAWREATSHTSNKTAGASLAIFALGLASGLALLISGVSD